MKSRSRERSRSRDRRSSHRDRERDHKERRRSRSRSKDKRESHSSTSKKRSRGSRSRSPDERKRSKSEIDEQSTDRGVSKPPPLPPPSHASSVDEAADSSTGISAAEKMRLRKEKMRLFMEKQGAAEEASEASAGDSEGAARNILAASVVRSTAPMTAKLTFRTPLLPKRSSAAVASQASRQAGAIAAPISQLSKASHIFNMGSAEDDSLGEARDKILKSSKLHSMVMSIDESPAVAEVVKEESGTVEEVAVDPLEAFMSEVNGLGDAAHGGPESAAIGTISFDDIVAAASGSGDTRMEADSAGEAAGASDETEVDEAMEQQYYAEFKAKLAEEKKAMEDAAAAAEAAAASLEKKDRSAVAGSGDLGVLFEDDDAAENMFSYGEEQSQSALEVMKEKMKKKELKKVDHNAMEYASFKKQFYIESPEVAAMTDEEVNAVRLENQTKVRGKKCPKPIRTWQQAGLSDRVMHALQKLGYERPFAIQAQALPAIMSGRDVIGIAKTGSGKTLAFLLPLFRHVNDQPPVRDGEGPIALVMGPARELVVQIYNEAKKFLKIMNLRAAAIYGGAPVSDQIATLKRGAEIVVCTPGRMIDILTMNSGRLISLTRVTFVVLDEADRMFDMGFEPQINMMIQNIRPRRQIVMFSATFPSHVEKLAKRVLKTPVEITVGGRSEVAGEIDQHVEVREDEDKWRRLLQLLGEWNDKGSILIFTDTQQRCDQLFQKLMSTGYFSLSLHGGMDQTDREQTISDFKNHHRNIMVATSVAGRGLDVKELVLVINFNCPNHLEDYVHRVGRTGRAGNKGTAYTFITPAEERFSIDIAKALTQSGTPLPHELQLMCDEYQRKIATGEARKRISGYATKGFKFDEDEASDAAKVKDMWKKQIELDAGIIDMDDILEEKREALEASDQKRRLALENDEEDDTTETPTTSTVVAPVVAATTTAVSSSSGASSSQASSISEAISRAVAIASAAKAASSLGAATLPGPTAVTSAPDLVAAPPIPAISLEETKAREDELISKMNPVERARYIAQRVSASAMPQLGPPTPVSTLPPPSSIDSRDAAAVRAAAVQAAVRAAAAAGMGTSLSSGSSTHFQEEVEINDYPQKARWQVTSKQAIARINDFTGAAITTRGSFVAAGRKPGVGERKLYLLVEGHSERSVRDAAKEIIRVLEETTLQLGLTGADKSQYGKYSVV